MAKNREGSINLFGAVQAKTEDGIVAHADGIAVEYDENGKPTKTLEQVIADGSLGGENSLEVIDVEELPSATIDTSTAVPSSGLIEKVYINTNLSVAEAFEIVSNLDIVEIPTYGLLHPIITNADMTKSLTIAKEVISSNNDYNYVIYLDRTPIGLVNKNEFHILQNEATFEYENMLSVLAPQVGATIQNDKLKQLISITPFEAPNPDIELDKLYRTPIKEGGEWVGTAVPNSSTVEKVYLNTELSAEEVTELVSGLTFIEGINAYILVRTDDNTYAVMKNGTTSEYYIMETSSSTVYWANTLNSELNITKIGWQEFTNPIEINAEASSESNAGAENDKLTSLISTTPFTQSDVNANVIGYKYNQFVNGEWKELGEDGDNENTPVVIEVDSSITINDELWDKALNNKVVILKVHSTNTFPTDIYAFKTNYSEIVGWKIIVFLSANILNGFQTITVIKNSDGTYEVAVNTYDAIDQINSLEINGGSLNIKYNTFFENAPLEVIGPHVDTETATDSDNLITSKAVRNYIAEYMAANYDNGDTEEF